MEDNKNKTKEELYIKLGNIALRTTKVVPVILGIIVVLVSGLTFWLLGQKLAVTSIEPIRIQNKIDDIMSITGALDQRMSALEKTIQTMPETELAELQFAEFVKKFEALSEDYQNLKTIIVKSPERALSIPLMKKEVESLDNRVTSLADSVNAQINQIYSFSKWFLGLMITLAIGLVTMGFVRRGK